MTMFFSFLHLPLFLSSLLPISAVPNFSQPSPTVTLGHTTVIGSINSTTNIDFFGGIPFASPPVGSLRFEPPVLQTSFPNNVTTFDATSFGQGCLQLVTPQSLFAFSEDCLTVNVFRPAGTAYGGGFHSGASLNFDPSTLIARSVSRGTPIVYSTRSRSIIGLDPGDSRKGNEVNATGGVNLGIKDLLAALSWIQANIAAFGGDPEKVTVFGESAGAIINSILFLNSQNSGLARGAILASGSPATSAAHTAPQGEALWESFVAGVPSCASIATSGSTLACMKEASATELLLSYNATGDSGWTPVIDGSDGVFPAIPSIVYAEGNFSSIPFISGDVLDEGTIFVPQIPGQNYSSAVIKAMITELYSPPLPGVTAQELSDQIDELLVLYPDDPALGSPYFTGDELFGLDSGWKRATSLAGDLLFQSSRRMWLQAAASRGSNVYSYLLTQPQFGGDPSLGVSHMSTRHYFYGDVLNDGVASDTVLSIAMMDYWLSFADSLDPNDGKGATRPTWNQWTTASQVILQLNGAENQTVMIDDDFRADGINEIISNPLVFYH
ncbi:Carboxylic ester hydrolase [Mycena sanguinolenta]|uniref:Carboxylic ester hydrolase n=1 Tax=Mycena sanguinolenta TaxID=230812 RepID=A0A8H6XY12_9AGAR|nr:Carboxylic ester hydrolase [Mycena sanguinolenta]